jgi:catechol 2,3-dioxygenase-like lactoylglutathione lyase family enzyme
MAAHTNQASAWPTNRTKEGTVTVSEPPSIHHLLWPVADLDRALEFYVGGLGMELAFRDGDRFAAVRAGAITLALVTGREDVTQGSPAPAYQVPDVPRAVSVAEGAGAEVLVRLDEGPHELRAVVRDPSGHPVVLYQRR